jgi:hypothetical protein
MGRKEFRPKFVACVFTAILFWLGLLGQLGLCAAPAGPSCLTALRSFKVGFSQCAMADQCGQIYAFIPLRRYSNHFFEIENRGKIETELIEGNLSFGIYGEVIR